MSELYAKGWFADTEDPGDADCGYSPDFPWRPVIQVSGACLPASGVWFASQADCETFIRDEIIGKGWLETNDGGPTNPRTIEP